MKNATFVHLDPYVIRQFCHPDGRELVREDFLHAAEFVRDELPEHEDMAYRVALGIVVGRMEEVADEL